MATDNTYQNTGQDFLATDAQGRAEIISSNFGHLQVSLLVQISSPGPQ